MATGSLAIELSDNKKPFAFLFLTTAVAMTLALNVAVRANPLPPLSAPDDSRVPLSKRVFDLKQEWRQKKEPQNNWREQQQEQKDKSLTLEKGRIESPSSPHYDPREHPDPWDPFYSTPKSGVHTDPPVLFKFRF